MSTISFAHQCSLRCNDSDTDMDSGSASDTDPGCCVVPSPPSSDIDPTAPPRTPTPEDSPAVISTGNWSPPTVTTLSEKDGWRLIQDGSERTLAAEAIPARFWKLLRARNLYLQYLPDLLDDIWAMRQEWLRSQPGAFVQKVRTTVCKDHMFVCLHIAQELLNVNVQLYNLLCASLQMRIPDADRPNRPLAAWMEFLSRLTYVNYASLRSLACSDRAQSVDFWQRESKVVVTAPRDNRRVAAGIVFVFKTIFTKHSPSLLHTPFIPEVLEIISDSIHLRLREKAVAMDERPSKGRSRVLFICEEAQNEAEFVYRAKTVSGNIGDVMPVFS